MMVNDADLALQEFEFRPYIENDVNFIQSSWGNSYYTGGMIRLHLSPQEFHEFHRPIRTNFFMRPTATAIVCVWKKDPSLIIGWIAVEKPKKSPGLILHYLYVKQAFKHEGVAQKLLKMALPDRPVLYTHSTERAQRLMRKHGELFTEFVFAPHLI